jgi:NAD(P)-dependent dehydrogenase (short-subunit alcohol dehydrogenase family)
VFALGSFEDAQQHGSARTVSKRAGLLEGRAAIVTGGSGGLGAAIAAAFAEAGAQGAVLDVIEAQALPPGWEFLEADVRDEASVESAFAKATRSLGRLDVAVANAGIVPVWTSVAEMSLAEWDQVLAVNATGVMLTVREAVRAMGAEGGSIVVMSSLNGWKGDPHIPAYVASKHAVVGLVRSAALGVGRQGVRVNAVAPGPVPTGALLARMEHRARLGGLSVEEALAEAAEKTALGRTVTAREVADVVLFLASDLSSGITGQIVPVDAGVA